MTKMYAAEDLHSDRINNDVAHGSIFQRTIQLLYRLVKGKHKLIIIEPIGCGITAR